MIRRPPRSPLFPSTTLFRPVLAPGGGLGFLTHNRTIAAFLRLIWDEEYVHHTMPEGFHDFARFITPEELTAAVMKRSEEHTSELQSRLHLVCRLLLEKKKTA